MGSQQFLLITLGVIIVGLSIAFTEGTIISQSEESTKAGIMLENHQLGIMSMRYYNTVSSMGGGGKSYFGWKIDARLDTTLNGIHTAIVLDKDKLLITGRPLTSTRYKWYIITKVNGREINSFIEENK